MSKGQGLQEWVGVYLEKNYSPFLSLKKVFLCVVVSDA